MGLATAGLPDFSHGPDSAPAPGGPGDLSLRGPHSGYQGFVTCPGQDCGRSTSLSFSLYFGPQGWRQWIPQRGRPRHDHVRSKHGRWAAACSHGFRLTGAVFVCSKKCRGGNANSARSRIIAQNTIPHRSATKWL